MRLPILRAGVIALRISRIRELREERDLTQTELARVLHIAQNTYSNYENGVREIPLELLIRLSRHYQVNLEYLLGLTDQPAPLPPSKRDL